MKQLRPVEPTYRAADFSRSATPADRPTMADVRHKDTHAYLKREVAKINAVSRDLKTTSSKEVRIYRAKMSKIVLMHMATLAKEDRSESRKHTAVVCVVLVAALTFLAVRSPDLVVRVIELFFTASGGAGLYAWKTRRAPQQQLPPEMIPRLTSTPNVLRGDDADDPAEHHGLDHQP